MAESLKVIYHARNGPEAHLLKNSLEQAGIKAEVTGAVLESGLGFGGLTRPRVTVAEKDAEAARQIVLEFERSLRPAAEGADQPEAPEEPQQPPSWWPRCPQCSRPRLAQCPFCGTAGTGFRPAGYPIQRDSQPGPSARLVICPVCDEAVVPRYLLECEWCGHRFAEGTAPPQDAFRTEWTWRLVIAAIVLGAILSGVIGYFAWLLSRGG